MERSSKRGKIPQQDWPSIIKRYEAGETLTSIARTYDCSPPAISYILTRSRARDATVGGTNGTPESGEAAALPSAAEASDPIDGSIPEMVSAGPGSPSNATAGVSEIGAEVAMTEILSRPADRDLELPAHAALSETGNMPDALGTAAPQPQLVEARRTLHLSLSQNNPQPMETPHHDGHVADMSDASAVTTVGDQQKGFAQHPTQHHPAPNPAANNGGAARSAAESHKRDGGAFIDRALRERVR